MEDEDVCDGIDLKWMYQSDSDDDDDWHNSAPVKYFTQEMSFRGRLRRLLIRNTQARLGGRLFDFIVKFIMCVLYFIRVLLDDHTEYWCSGSGCGNNTEPHLLPQNEDDGMKFSSAEINWHVVLWVYRPMPLWCVQVILAFATFIKAILFIFVSKGNRFEQVLTSAFLLECICSLPLIATLFYPMVLKDLFIPTFLNCWLAKLALERLFNDLHLTKQRFQTISVTLSQQLLILNVTLCCLIFTTICGIQHIQRGSLDRHLTMFESFYFVIVTFSTVGYGDISPDIWLGQLFVVIMICVAFVFLPRQIEGIASTFVERQKAGGEYGKKQARRNRHVVVCSTKLTSEQTMDFLSEFYAHPKLEDHIVLLLGSDELGSNMNIILRDPKWSNRVIYIRGSALKDLDLKRCRINEAEACFILAPGSCSNKEQADQHTILRSWAVKDFAPNCNQYIQLFRAENKIHVKFAEHVVCQDEFKYALLANNCCYPGLSTLVSLLVHTSTGNEGDMATESWQQVYGRHSGNEIYHIQLCKSKFFSSYEGKKFSDASAGAHERFGVTLMGIMETDTTQNNDILLQLNPGPNYIMKATDFCFYMNITKEEYSTIQDVTKLKQKTEREKNYEKLAHNLGKYLESHGCDDEEEDGEESVFNTLTSQGGSEMAKRMLSINSQTEQTDITIELSCSEDPVDGPDISQSAKVLQMYDDMGQDE
ncbi:hypothetical protein KUTeg_014809 [Tegillarca granosa]|uniref:Uncharacterized protein n=1 Tax=Tegillarca granosa TaxID=220873 RepID=A0ABQ9E9H5_TEGGR|nr:hypothetical protein KUTeg_020959 [Tegillarca granosa]KAJ8307644.1 hypothetical protein KUTeg_014809 [Tegillarca granosa]